MFRKKTEDSSAWSQDVIIALEKLMDEREKRINERAVILRAFIEERIEEDRKTTHKYFEISKLMLDTHIINSDKMLEHRMSALDERFRAVREMQDKVAAMSDAAMNAAIAASKESILKAEISTEKRFDSVNELRSSLNAISNKMMPRPEVESAIKAVDEKVGMVSSRIDQMTGAEKHNDKSNSTIMSVIAIIISGLIGLMQFVTYESTIHPAVMPVAPYTQTAK
jgi:hypothetical protein